MKKGWYRRVMCTGPVQNAKPCEGRGRRCGVNGPSSASTTAVETEIPPKLFLRRPFPWLLRFRQIPSAPAPTTSPLPSANPCVVRPGAASVNAAETDERSRANESFGAFLRREAMDGGARADMSGVEASGVAGPQDDAAEDDPKDDEDE